MPLTSIVATLDAACAVIEDATKVRRRRTPRPAYRFPRMDLLPIDRLHAGGDVGASPRSPRYGSRSPNITRPRRLTTRKIPRQPSEGSRSAPKVEPNAAPPAIAPKSHPSGRPLRWYG